MKISRWMAAIGVAASATLAGGHVASAAPGVPTNGPSCAQGAITIITDSSGAQQEACVAVEAPSVAPPTAGLTTPADSRPASAPAPRTLPSTGLGTGGLLIAALLVGSGSIVSLLSRRRPAGVRKGFRGRRATP